jgi:hypothetical protein
MTTAITTLNSHSGIDDLRVFVPNFSTTTNTIGQTISLRGIG